MRTQGAVAIIAVLVPLLAAGTCLAGDPVESSLPIGASVNEFLVTDITGQASGMRLCYRCRYADAPVICVFARKTSEPLATLVKQIDQKLGASPALKSFVVIMPTQGQDVADSLRKLVRDMGIRYVPLTIGASPNGPPDYRIAQDADVTVLMWKQGKVRTNHAYKGLLTPENIQSIVADVPKLLE